MKLNCIGIAVYTLYCSVNSSTQAQGSFQNLDFESANVAPSGPEPYGTFVPIGSALPGWTAYLGAQQLTQVGYNAPTLSLANISLIGPNWNSSDTGIYGAGIIDGNYSVLVQAGGVPTNAGQGESASIAQNGTVPTTAESLQFKAFAENPFSVSFAGNVLGLVVLSSGVSADGLPYNLYAANISAWAGQTGELEFTADNAVNDPYLVLDDIAFSPNPVPEPGTLALMLTAIGAYGVRRWRAKESRAFRNRAN